MLGHKKVAMLLSGQPGAMVHLNQEISSSGHEESKKKITLRV
jgi:hypothetical protein